VVHFASAEDTFLRLLQKSQLAMSLLPPLVFHCHDYANSAAAVFSLASTTRLCLSLSP